MSQEKFQQAVNLFKVGNRKQASELLLEIVKSDSNNTDAWFGLALCTDVIEKKKLYLKKVLEINPQHNKAAQLLEKFNIENHYNSPILNKKEEASATNTVSSIPNTVSATTNIVSVLGSIVSFIIIGILLLCVALLFYKVNKLEKNLAQTIDNLSYVEAVAKNADNYAHSHNNFSDSRLKTNISKINDPECVNDLRHQF